MKRYVPARIFSRTFECRFMQDGRVPFAVGMFARSFQRFAAIFPNIDVFHAFDDVCSRDVFDVKYAHHMRGFECVILFCAKILCDQTAFCECLL